MFCSLLKNRETKKTSVKRANDLISEDIVSSQGTVSDAILQKREKSRGGGSGCFASPNLSLSRNADEGTSGGRQMDVLSSFDKSTVSGCNSADLDAAIAQLVYCKALPFLFGECPYFQRVIDVARSAPRGYKAPKRTLLAGEMLDLAYISQLERDLKQLMIDADIFGIAFLVMVPLFTNVLLSICLLQLFIAQLFLLTSLIVLQGWLRAKRKMDLSYPVCSYL